MEFRLAQSFGAAWPFWAFLIASSLASFRIATWSPFEASLAVSAAVSRASCAADCAAVCEAEPVLPMFILDSFFECAASSGFTGGSFQIAYRFLFEKLEIIPNRAP